MLAAFIVLAALQADPLEKELSEIVRRLDSAELADRQSAVRDLEVFARKAGAKAPELLKAQALSERGEARARLEDQLQFLARLDDCRKVLAVFEAIGLPDCKGKALAIYNPNSWWRGTDTFGFQYVLGWVLSETKEEVALAETNLTTRTYRRDRTLPDDWDHWKEKHPKNRPLPGELRVIDFASFCGRLLEEGPAEDFGDLGHFSRGGLSHGFEPALYAFWALQRGEEKLALKLVELSRKAAAERRGRDEAKPLGETLRLAVAGNLRWQAVTSANGGEPRERILDRWKTLEKIVPDFREGEPKEMTRHYGEMVAEDGEWKDPSPDALAKMDPPARVSVWMHRLRDHAATQWSQPGSCDVLGRFGGGREGVPNPADELVKLSWDSLPAIIDHLDDRRPTRCMGYHRNFAPDSYYLLRVGDCCQQVFEAITGFDIYRRRSTSGAMVKDGDAPAAKAAAQKWWEENRKEGAEAFYLKGLGRNDSLSFSASRLLDLDAKRHLPRLLEMLENGERERRRTLLPLLQRHLSKEHRPLLETFLNDGDLSTVVIAADALWKSCGSESGAHEVIARLKALKKEDEESDRHNHLFTSHRSFQLLLAIRSDAIVEGVCALMSSPVTRVRMDAMSCGASLPSRRTAEAFVRQFEDTASTGWSSNYKIRFCDQAAEQFIEMVDLRQTFKLGHEETQRDRTIVALKEWWEKNREGVDWAYLARRIEAARAPKK